MPTIIEAKDLKRTYGKGQSAFDALKGITLTVRAGETLAITGKSGSGKSTLMHLLALLDTPSGGTIKVDGTKASGLKRKELDHIRNSRFGFVFQQFFLNATDSVLSNVILPLKIAGVSPRERSRRGMEVLKAVDLDDKAKSKALDLSGGQKQRVVIARALINNPDVIFADEPTGNLDSVNSRKIENLLFKLNKQQGITLIFVTHDNDLSKRCDRQVNLVDGLIRRARKK